MSKPEYFRRFPNLDYAIESDHAGNLTTLEIKDYFHLLRLKEEVYPDVTLYKTHFVKNGQRPDQVSYELYGNEKYYWIILQINDIVDPYNEWPMSSYELESYIKRKYGSYREAEKVMHYETPESFDNQGNLILPGKLVVDKDYVYRHDQEYIYPVEVTYLDYEYRLNEEKATISVLKERHIPDFIRDVNRYSSQLVSDRSEFTIADAIFTR